MHVNVVMNIADMNWGFDERSIGGFYNFVRILFVGGGKTIKIKLYNGKWGGGRG